MIRPIRLLAALAFALSVTGCAGLPSALVANAPAAATDDASLKVTIGAGYRTQAFPDIALTLRLELPWAQDPSKRVQVISVQDGVPAEFKNLPRGFGTLTAIATNITTKQVVDKQSQPIELRPGIQAQANFTLVIGGSSAADIYLNFYTENRYIGNDMENDGLDGDFRNAPDLNGSVNFVWTRGTQSMPVVYTFMNGDARRQIGDGPDEYAGWKPWMHVPKHAVRVDSNPYGEFQTVRHYRWDNVYMLDGQEQMLVIDRWVSPYNGLLKEQVSRPSAEGPVLVTSLVREGL